MTFFLILAEKINIQTPNLATSINNQETFHNPVISNNDRYDKPAASHIIEKPPVPTVPRAIRGVGAITNEKDNNKNSLKFKNDNDIWRESKSTYNKGWGHDDRFDKDYS